MRRSCRNDHVIEMSGLAATWKPYARFLVGKNDDGELNLNRLSLVGAGTGCDGGRELGGSGLGAPPLTVGKQGQA